MTYQDWWVKNKTPDCRGQTVGKEIWDFQQKKIETLEEAYKLARDAGVRLLYYSDDRRIIGDICENELKEAETLYRTLTREN